MRNGENKQGELTAAETCRRLGVSLDYVYRLLYAGQLAARKIDKTWRISATAVEERAKQREARLAA
jgi:excisionase family DNA binding protein